MFNLQAKITQVLENVNDFKLNFNYGLDKLYLEDNIVCDEIGLQSNLENAIMTINDLYMNNQDKFQNVEDLTKKIANFYELLSHEKSLSNEIKNLLESFERTLLISNMIMIKNSLILENEILEKELLL